VYGRVWNLIAIVGGDRGNCFFCAIEIGPETALVKKKEKKTATSIF